MEIRGMGVPNLEDSSLLEVQPSQSWCLLSRIEEWMSLAFCKNLLLSALMASLCSTKHAKSGVFQKIRDTHPSILDNRALGEES